MDHTAVPEVHPADMATTANFEFLREREVEPDSEGKLYELVTSIDESLRQVEAKCIELSVLPGKRIPRSQTLSVDQYQKLMSFHHTLLQDHHDFFLACQHPLAGLELRDLPAKYNMPARMWRYGIQLFLDLLRERLPGSLEHMRTFIDIAYSTMEPLSKSVPEFASFWIESLGDLSRCRITIEDDDIRETWASVSRAWYSKASDRSPEVGRLYHHLALLARPDALQQLYYYSKSLCVSAPFPTARDTVMSLFKPILARKTSHNLSYGDFVRVHAIIFTGLKREELHESMAEFLCTLDRTIAETNKDWLHPGYYMAISLICSLFGYGTSINPLKLAIPVDQVDAPVAPAADPAASNDVIDEATATKTFETARSFAMQTCYIVFCRNGDTNCLPFFHTIMVFLYYLAEHPAAMSLVANHVPWRRVAAVLNEARSALVERVEVLRPARTKFLRPLPEDYGMQGFEFSKNYFPEDWFSTERVADNEEMFDPDSLADERRQRMLQLAIERLQQWIPFDEGLHHFVVNDAFDNV